MRYVVDTERVEHGCCYVAMIRDSSDTTFHEKGQFVAEFGDVELANRVCEFLNEGRNKVGSSRQFNPDDERPKQSDEFLISRTALDEAHSALAGCKEALGDIANISHAMEQLKTAQGNLGDTYNGH